MVEPEEKETAPSAVGEAGAAQVCTKITHVLCAPVRLVACVYVPVFVCVCIWIVAAKRDLTCIRICSTSNRNVMLALEIFCVANKKFSVFNFMTDSLILSA